MVCVISLVAASDCIGRTRVWDRTFANADGAAIHIYVIVLVSFADGRCGKSIHSLSVAAIIDYVGDAVALVEEYVVLLLTTAVVPVAVAVIFAVVAVISAIAAHSVIAVTTVGKAL